MLKHLVASLAALALIACQPLADPDPQDTGSSLAVQFGDSLSWDSREEITSLYRSNVSWRVSLNHYPGTEFDTPTWTDRYPSVGEGSAVVLALGTNDLSNDTLTVMKADARAAIAAVTDAGAARVVVPTLNVTSADQAGGDARRTKAEQWNAWLAQAENSTHVDYRALDVVDWAGVSAGRTDWLRADGVHHTTTGEQAYAQFLYDARLPGGTP